MLRRIRSRLTYSNVVASMALFIALGGISYAAVKLPKNSVGSSQIRKNSVTGSKVKNSSLTGSDVKNSSLTGSDVKNSSLTGSDVKNSSLTGSDIRNKSLTAADFNGSIQGPQGAQGPKGDQGPAGPNVQLKDATGAVVGRFLGLIPEGGAVYSVERDGGYWFYLGSGQVFSFGSPTWKTSDCSGTAYLRNSSSSFSAATFALLVGGPFRVSFRTLSAGVFGPPSAWKGTGASETLGVATQLYRRDSTTGVCAADGGPTTGNLAALTPVDAPPDFAGPLAIA